MICQIATRPNAHNLRCLFRVIIVPADPIHLLENDRHTFEYFYQQCCNDIVYERFRPEIRYEMSIRLASMHIIEHVLSHHHHDHDDKLPNRLTFSTTTVTTETSKTTTTTPPPMNINQLKQINLKLLDEEYGLENFVPNSLYKSMKRKELMRLLLHSIKLNQHLFLSNSTDNNNDGKINHHHHRSLNILKKPKSTNSLDTLTTSSSSSLSSLSRLHSFNNHHHYKNHPPIITSLQAKLNFLKILSELPCYGAKMFITTRRLINEDVNGKNSNQHHSHHQSNIIIMNESIIINPKYGISYMNNLNPVSYPQTVAKLNALHSIRVIRNDQTLLNDIEIYVDHHKLNNATNENVKADFVISLDSKETKEFLLFVRAYHSLLMNNIKQQNNENLKQLIDRSSLKIESDSPNEWWNDGGNF